MSKRQSVVRDPREDDDVFAEALQGGKALEAAQRLAAVKPPEATPPPPPPPPEEKEVPHSSEVEEKKEKRRDGVRSDPYERRDGVRTVKMSVAASIDVESELRKVVAVLPGGVSRNMFINWCLCEGVRAFNADAEKTLDAVHKAWK